VFAAIDKNTYVADIHAVNTSAECRQGRRMGERCVAYRSWFPPQDHARHFGVIAPDGKLVAYLDVLISNEVAYVEQLLGHVGHLKAGIMYLLLVDAIRCLMIESACRYFMYDMFFGARAGLRLFKKRLGFAPHHVRWEL
jgi:hypothetical protein